MSINNSSDKILFMQTADQNRYRILLEASSRTVKEYCIKYGFIYEQFLGIWRGVHPWQATYNRIPLLMRLINTGFHGWVCYMDADAYVADLEFDLPGYLESKRSYAIIIELCNANGPWWNVNAGVFLINLGHPTAKAIVKQWSQLFDELSDKELRDAIVWEQIRDDQSMLQGCLKTIPEAESCTYIERGLLNYSAGTFIRQLLRAGSNFTERVKKMQSEADRILGSSTQNTQNQILQEGFGSPDVASMQEDLARAIYRVLLLREPDPIGLAHAVRAFRNGKSIEASILSTLRCDEFVKKLDLFIEKNVISPRKLE